jgi:hypothetical protein
MARTTWRIPHPSCPTSSDGGSHSHTLSTRSSILGGSRNDSPPLLRTQGGQLCQGRGHALVSVPVPPDPEDGFFDSGSHPRLWPHFVHLTNVSTRTAHSIGFWLRSGNPPESAPARRRAWPHLTRPVSSRRHRIAEFSRSSQIPAVCRVHPTSARSPLCSSRAFYGPARVVPRHRHSRSPRRRSSAAQTRLSPYPSRSRARPHPPVRARA